jgi:site-specific DNA recombinase
MSTTNVIIFCRTSTPGQPTERQHRELQSAAARMNYKVKKVFEEQVSGTLQIEQRSEFAKMLEYVKDKKNNISKILVHELSRLGRHVRIIKNTIEDLSDLGISVYIMNMGIETLDSNGKRNFAANLIIDVLNNLAAQERETIIERSRSGLRNSARNGRAGGGPIQAMGYKKDVNKNLIIDEKEADIVRQIFDLSLAGHGTRVIANILNQRKIPTKYNKKIGKTIKYKLLNLGKEKKREDVIWVGNTVLNILKNPIYCGCRRFKNEFFDSPVIIQKDKWDQVQVQLRNNYQEHSRNTRHNYILKKKITCGLCGHYYCGRKRRSLRDNYYMCSTKLIDKNQCKNKGIGIDTLENIVWSILKNNPKPEYFKDIKEDRTSTNTKLNTLNEELKFNEKILIDYAKQRNKLINMLSSELISEKEYTRNVNDLNKKRKNINRKISNIKGDITYLNAKNSEFDNIDVFFEKHLSSNAYTMVSGYIRDIVIMIYIYSIKQEQMNLFRNLVNSIYDVLFYLEVFIRGSDIPKKIICSRMIHDRYWVVKDEVVYDKTNKTVKIKNKSTMLNMQVEKVHIINKNIGTDEITPSAEIDTSTGRAQNVNNPPINND